jgi:arginyl-tRNA synthetase
MTDLEKMTATYQNYNPRQTALSEARAFLTQAAQAAMAAGDLPEAEVPAFIVEIPADVKNGDIASNLAMAGARAWRKAPKMIAEALCKHLDLTGSCFARVEVAGPGFINLFLAPSFFSGVVLAACSNPEYGRTDYGQGRKFNVEFVSANPTGPMHMGNARGGALGDCLAAVLDWAGYDVTREFYINDAGNQIQKFGKSLAVRYLQHYLGAEACPLPAECYQGGDIKVLAEEFAALPEQGDRYVAACKGLEGDALYASEGFAALKDALVNYALPKNIAALKRDLGKYRIDYDVWFHESTLHEAGDVKQVVDLLLDKGACYRAEDGAVMYRSAQYAEKYGTANKKKTEDGSEEEAKDEVLVRANGIPTYFAADIAYHYNKLATRGFDRAIDVWGADHHGHVARMKGAMDAIGLDGSRLDVVLMQMVNLMRDGQPVRMSKRTGNAITLTDLLEEVPIDSARFLFNMHDAGSGIDFDLDQAVRTDNENPVYYVQYAHARICSILKKLESEGVPFAGADKVDPSLLVEPAEMELIRMLAAFPQEIVQAAEKYDPSRINRFVIDLASAFHRFYNTCRIQGADPAVQQARLALCVGVKNAIYNVLTMFKITVPEKM